MDNVSTALLSFYIINREKEKKKRRGLEEKCPVGGWLPGGVSGP